MSHGAIKTGKVAFVTGGASGIGLAAARRFMDAGMKVLLTDLPGDALDQAAQMLKAEGGDVTALAVDVTDRDQLARAREKADQMGQLSMVMSNAGREGGGEILAGEEVWKRTLETNLWGAIHVSQLFLPDLIAAEQDAAIIFTGSKQGITLPPGDTAYNVSKAALRALAESVSHDLVKKTGGRVSAHLLIPGFTFTGFTRAHGVTEKPEAAWAADQVADFLMSGLDHGDFYILCPDNDVDRATDEKRMRWGIGDIIENRPALSRWHPDYADAFDHYMKSDD
ncbi:NAD(P)-dependent dehydrogenase, short-chain alcohol dehydrogenase family [Cohaesibacter sp. ES.047]|uniref:SDR family NAD(P)-dependent oxidoreductase n=1 Tax=Cohaesibacter sp. ES.047 TaxID=1798205 RepID=UPI000BB728C7|nr:SDR family NAD(P)-dependent oxidoreductase [Cohaesibacter sp. ES.047]SNY92255.1 NAD(P)-dependent dehydrogenase, short-chain alcohol dehydrogenase family [Cohaesibacter sp. ES.047]